MPSFRPIIPRLSIRAKLITAFVALSVIPLLFLGIYDVNSNMKTLRQFALAGLTHDVETVRSRAGSFVQGVEGDLAVLRNSSLMDEFLASLDRRVPAAQPADTRKLAAEILAFSKTKKIYYQISILSNDQAELLRVECSNIASGGGDYRIVPQDKLREYGGALYFYLMERSPPNGIVAFPAEMKYGENGQLPVVNIVVPLFGEHGRLGLLVASVFAGNLLDVLRAGRTFEQEAKVILIGNDGHFFYHSDLKDDWNRLIAERREGTLESLYPPAICREILSGKEGIVTDGSPDIIAYAPLFPGRGNPPVGDELLLTESLFVLEAVPAGTIVAPARSYAVAFAFLLALILGSAVILGVVATRQFTRPIAEVASGAETIARGNYAQRLAVKTGDEIETLAEQFNKMARALESHEEEIFQHRSKLEEMVRARTTELADEKVKLQAILDNVPSAFLLLDRAFRIQAASASFGRVTGLTTTLERGLDARALFAEHEFCFEDLNHSVESGRIESHIDRLGEPGTAARLIEHTTIPIADEGSGGAIVMIMSDVTQRKRLEQQLIQSEKLMATGEMAAIIAHEFRNALTSIKMILQLQQESVRQSDGAWQSLDVALASIRHMELIVQDLLNFARPSPLDPHESGLRAIIDECLAFTRLRLQKQGITVHCSVDDQCPPLVVDTNRIREAIINLLLNAIQAIEGKENKSANEVITISVKRIVLTKTLRDFHLSDSSPLEGDAGGAQREFVLRKGTECVLIAIADTGPGIAGDVLPRIFNPFFTTKVDGTGLGLPMVKRTVNAHGGIVVVRSTRGRGSSFEIVLPIAHEPADSLRAKATSSEVRI